MTGAPPGRTAFDLESCAASAAADRLQDWVIASLDGGPWANPGLRDGLLLHRPFWTGPVAMPLARLERCCGPEPEMAYRMPLAGWAARIDAIAESLDVVESLPPLIVEWQTGRLIVRDGNHRHGAMTRRGWVSCFAVVWCNSAVEREAMLSHLP
ncbi:hypothetical protein [Ensifer soli]|uniref:hypothetical protein n=1 Tax=Ciceribacter sp. sgz301302 TaxID=3342379 RepID=UPI0035B8F8E9